MGRQMTQGFDGMANAVLPILMTYSDVFTEWTFEYPGWVALHTDGGGLWAIGDANGTWAADLYLDEDARIAGEAPDHSIDTGIPADCQDAVQIAETLYHAMTNLHVEGML